MREKEETPSVAGELGLVELEGFGRLSPDLNHSETAGAVTEGESYSTCTRRLDDTVRTLVQHGIITGPTTSDKYTHPRL